MPSVQRGYFVIADISGYTNYVTRVELDHAQSILTNLLELIKDAFQPRLLISKFEGDAVFAYAPETRILWKEGLSELLEAAYARFRSATSSMRRQTTCECNACRAIPSLDLKFIAHYGEYIEQDVSGAKELLGSDVILAHRLLKNQVFARTGWSAYLLFTRACLDRLGIAYPQMCEYTESYEHFGEVPVSCADLHVAYQEAIEARRALVKPEDADGKVVVTIRASRQEVWEWLNDPQKRLLWEKLDIRPVLRPMGRISVGARSHCYHGKQQAMLETVVDWRPFDYFTVDKEFTVFMVANKLRVTTYLRELEDGATQLTMAVKRIGGAPAPFFSFFCEPLLIMMGIDQNYRALPRLIEQPSTQN